EVFLDFLRRQPGRAPITLLHAIGVDQIQILHAERGAGLQNAFEHFGTGQGQDQGERERGWWLLVKMGAQQGMLSVDLKNLSLSIQTIDQSDPQALAGIQLQNILQMAQLASPHFRQAIGPEVRRAQEQQVHDSVVSDSDGAARFWTKRPKNTPASNSIHMGTASRVWEMTSGGVSNI